MQFLSALAMFLTSATAVSVMQVRVSDIFVFLFLVSLLFLENRRTKINIFASILLGTILISTILQSYLGLNLFIANGFANTLSIPFGIFLAAFCFERISKNVQLNIMFKYNLIAIFVCITLYFYQFFFGNISWIELVDETDRYSALSLNPNQLALYLLPIPFFAYLQYLLGGISIRFVIVQVTLVLLINYFTIGKGLFVAWILAFFIFLILGGQGKINYNKIAFKLIIFMAVVPVIYYSIAPLIAALYAGDAPGSVAGQGDLRLHLWLNGLKAWLDAPYFGHGPGHYSGIDFAYEGVESHNMMIDWLSAYGIAGALALIALFGNLIRQSIKLKSWLVLSFYVCLTVQSMFHFYGRQPVYWIWWIVGLTAAEALTRVKEP